MTNKTINIHIDLFPWQSDCINQIESYPHDIHVIKSKRQTGKSIMCQLIVLKTALSKSNSISAYLLPTFKQCSKAFRELSKMIRHKSFVQKINNSQMIIDFVNGSSIQFFSGEQDLSAIQGYTVSGVLIIDEGAFISNDVYESISPWCNVYEPPIIIVSTPQFKQGFFYDLYSEGLRGADNVHCFDFTNYDTTALLSPDKLEFYRKTLPSSTFRSHYLGQFIENNGAVFGDFSACLRPKDQPVNPYTDCFFGIDWGSGTGNDYTAITIISNDKQVVDIQYFNDLTPIQTIERITLLASQYQPHKIVAEKNSIGEIYLSMLKQSIQKAGFDIPVLSFITTNDSKYRIVSQLQVAIQNNEISLPDIAELCIQLSGYEQTLSQSNKPIFNGKKGLHDDLVMSLMIALDLVTQKRKSIIL